MGRRYNDIRRAQALLEAKEALAAYRANPPAPRIGIRGPLDPRKDVFVSPFGLTVADGELARSTVNEEHYTVLAPLINGTGSEAEVTDTLGTNDIAKVFRYTPARVVWFRNTTVTFTTERSERTNQPYRKYAGDSLRCAFGRKLTANNMYDAFVGIKGRVRAVNGFEMSRVTMTPEKVTLS